MLLSDEWIENSIETYIYQHTTKSQMIYWAVLLAVTATLVSLPFIHVDISVRGSGVVRPVAEKAEITSPIAETVDSVFVREGEQVRKGDAILKFRTNNPDYKIHYHSGRLNDCSAQLADLSYLAQGECPEKFSSPVRRQEYVYFVKRRKELETALAQAEKEYDRHKALYDKQVISEEEYETYLFKLQKQQNELASLIQSQLSSWQADLNSCRNTYSEMNASLKQEVREREMYVVRSPVDGTVDQFSGVYRGSNIQAGQTLAVISPDSTLCLEVYVTPRNIGFITTEMPVKVQVESFNYNEWGSLMGRVKEVSSDFMTDSQGNAFYRVRCEVERDYLQLKNGRIGRLKKGMTAAVHFMVTRRSLFDLLYQKMDSWMNPNQYVNEKMIAKLN
ncbi:MAG: HlyD family efflux transporter periplasmic adaptor subunit [Bacteroides sp.]|nr:HlyD family efflux transporter periplasmic adaptor subunit [Bacteroides sp.]